MRYLPTCLSSLILLALLVPVASTASPPAQAECLTIRIEPSRQTICPDDEVTFTARATNGEIPAQQRFNWTVSAGRIIRGQGTRTITVSATGPGGVSVSVELAGADARCALTFSRAVDVTPFCPERKFDEYGDLSFEEEKARLALFAAEIRGTPDTTGVIIIRASGKRDVEEGGARLERARNYLVNELGLEADRIFTREGDVREELAFELWLMPSKVPRREPNQDFNSGTGP
jgi:hypothetical protein